MLFLLSYRPSNTQNEPSMIKTRNHNNIKKKAYEFMNKN